MLRNNLMLPTEALDIPEAIDFDGTNDYLSRSSDLVGNADGKTFTFSAWVWNGNSSTQGYTYSTNQFSVRLFTNGSQLQMLITGRTSGSATILDVTSSFGEIPANTYFNLLVSLDLSSTANRYVYLNDIPVPATWGIYTNNNIDFTGTSHSVATDASLSTKKAMRLSHVYLDYTYRDLSVEANRRLFITADRKPAANQQALNPILYLPLNDPTQPGKNLGTGGDFNLTGVVARSGRGPNQFNAPYSDLNGSTQNVVRTSALVGASDGKQFTFACAFNTDNVANVRHVFDISNSTSANRLTIEHDNTKSIVVRAANSAGTNILWLGTPANSTAQYRNFVVVVSFDLTDTGKRHISINGVNQTLSVYTYTDDTIDFVPATPRYSIGLDYVGGGYWDGRLGNVFFDTRYIDLSQPANLAKFVTGTGIDAKPADLGANGEKPFGTAPLIYLPMYGNNAGKNYGTGGDFTVNSGPFTGARGPNEFWGNKADGDGASGYFARTSALTGVSNGKAFSFSIFLNKVSGVTEYIFFISPTTRNRRVLIYFNSSNELAISASNSSGTLILDATATGAPIGVGNHHICGYVDLGNTSNRGVYVDGVALSMTWNTYTNDTVDYAGGDRVTIGANWTGTAYNAFFDSALAEFYFTTDYIDFSLEANRLKFRDAFGAPCDLTPQIKAGTLPNPAIYMRFPPDNFGKNYGTGGDFTVNGIITDGGQL